MIRVVVFSIFVLCLCSCKDKLERPPSSGSATVLLNQELWESEVVLISRDRSVGWDNIIFTEYWSDNSVKAEFEIAVDFDLLVDQSTHPFSTNIVPLPSVELDSIISIFGYNYTDGDVTAASYNVTYETDLSNEMTFEIDADDPKLVTARWEAKLALPERWKDKAKAEGHPDTIRMENGVAAFRLP